MSSSSIEWTDVTWNPVSGCTRASAGCDNCYAVTMTRRLAAMGQEKYAGLVNEGKHHFNGIVRTHSDALELPLRWRKPRRVFVNSMSDLFHKDVPFEFIDRVFSVMAGTPRHTYQVLTKRPERMAEYLNAYQPSPPRDGFITRGGVPHNHAPRGSLLLNPERWPLPNVWLGVSVEDQAAADERIPHLLRTPAAVRFLSCEPLLGGLDLDGIWGYPGSADGGQLAKWPIHWVIVGGESGAGARGCDVAWIRSLVRQCRAAVVPVFVKQMGANPRDGDLPAPVMLRDRKGAEMAGWPADLRIREWPRCP